ncbi:MAG: hypothetical protein ACOC1P_05830, partial [Minisyncoccales bacterium]
MKIKNLGENLENFTIYFENLEEQYYQISPKNKDITKNKEEEFIIQFSIEDFIGDKYVKMVAGNSQK